MTREEFVAWKSVERQIGQLKVAKEKEELIKFRRAGQHVKLEALALTDYETKEERKED